MLLRRPVYIMRGGARQANNSMDPYERHPLDEITYDPVWHREMEGLEERLGVQPLSLLAEPAAVRSLAMEVMVIVAIVAGVLLVATGMLYTISWLINEIPLRWLQEPH